MFFLSPRLSFAAAVCVSGWACGDTSAGGVGPGGTRPPGFQLSCDLATDFLYDGGVARNGIPALTDPVFVAPGHPDAAYLNEYEAAVASTPQFPELRVFGLVVGGQPVAIPFPILWWHEIVHLDLDGVPLAVTLCPLTGSGLVFDLGQAGTERFGVSGLVYQNNLMMFDVETESLWPQMVRGARCGSRTGQDLQLVPMVEMRWDRWRELHPTTLVVSSKTGEDRNYGAYPYDLYEAADEFLIFPVDNAALDRSRPLKERVLGVPSGSGGMAFPFAELQALGSVGVVNTRVDGEDMIVLWDEAANGAWAVRPSSGTTLTVTGGRIVDTETGSEWTVDGLAVSGPRTGERLQPVESYVAFWFAWRLFQPDAEVWLRP